MRHACALSDYLLESTSPSLESFELAHLNASSNSKKRLIKLLANGRRGTRRDLFASTTIGLNDRPASSALSCYSALALASSTNICQPRIVKSQALHTASKSSLKTAYGSVKASWACNENCLRSSRPDGHSPLQLRLALNPPTDQIVKIPRR